MATLTIKTNSSLIETQRRIRVERITTSQTGGTTLMYWWQVINKCQSRTTHQHYRHASSNRPERASRSDSRWPHWITSWFQVALTIRLARSRVTACNLWRVLQARRNRTNIKIWINMISPSQLQTTRMSRCKRLRSLARVRHDLGLDLTLRKRLRCRTMRPWF